MNTLLSLTIGYFAVLLWAKFGGGTGADYSVAMAAAAIPAFIIGWFSTNKIGRFLIAPATSCLCILLPPWIEMHRSEMAAGGDVGVLFFMVVVQTPGYCLLYVGASMLGSYSKRFIKNRISLMSTSKNDS
ncbi:hypothetical protein ACN9MZ_12570 [Pseudoduganella sp. S-14]|jgi:hypothetical protein|uniref:hypothetical protein n=1 Tax=Pseudoduganella sp. S-14 TaxID=3404065 RepID=UPI003CEF0E6B